MVRQKMAQPEYIIMCLEDGSDWSNASTRKLVMQVRAGQSCVRTGSALCGHGARQRLLRSDRDGRSCICVLRLEALTSRSALTLLASS